MKLKTLVIGAVIAASLSSVATAEGLLNKNWAGLNLQSNSSDKTTWIDQFGVNVNGNYNVTEAIDINGVIGFASGDEAGTELKSTRLGFGSTYSFNTSDTLNPFIGASLFFQKDESTTNSVSTDETNVGFGISAGTEYNPTDAIALNGKIGYEIFSAFGTEFNTVNINGSAGYWFTDNILASLDLGYDTERESFGIGVSGTYQF